MLSSNTHPLRDDVTRLITRQAAWHGVGESFGMGEKLTASAAVRRARIDYPISLAPLNIHLGTRELVDPQRMAVVRPSTGDIFGIVPRTFRVLQARVLARLLDPLSRTWPVEAAGQLAYGRTIFLVLKADDGQVGGDEIASYFLVSDDRGGRGALRFAFTPVRIRCTNALVSALDAATVSISIPHTRGIRARASAFVDLQAKLYEARLRVLESMETLVHTQLDDGGVAYVIEAAYPLPKEPAQDAPRDTEQTARWFDLHTRRYEARRDHQLGMRELVLTAYQRFNDEHPQHARSGWAVYNAVAEAEDHLRPGPARIRQRSAIFGAGAVTKRRAFSAALDLV
jgi:hypothetical protein